MRGSSKEDIEDFRSERELLEALTVGRAKAVMSTIKLIVPISFHAIVTSRAPRTI
jgi:hypothetical protein